MTVKELIEQLSEYPEETQVILSADSEGNSFSPLSEGFTPCEYDDREIRTEEHYKEGGWDDELKIEDYSPNAIVLWSSH